MYKGIFSRNEGIISKKIQKEIAKKRILFAGCGLGGNIAELCVRVGFRNFILIDGDRVAISNLNRQVFFRNDIGENKAISLAKKIRLINPKATIKVYSKRFAEKDVAQIQPNFDYVVNTFDFGPAMIALTLIALKKQIPILFPFNVDNASFLLTIRRESEVKFFKNKKVNTNDDFYSLLFSIFRKKIPSTLHPQIKKIIQYSRRKKFTPQLGITSSVSSSLVIQSLVNLISRKRVEKISFMQLP